MYGLQITFEGHIRRLFDVRVKMEENGDRTQKRRQTSLQF